MYNIKKSNREIKVGSFLNYIQMGISIILGIVYTPLLTELLGQNEYGLYSTVVSTISMISILNLGFSSSYIRYFSKFKQQNDFVALAELNGMFVSIFSIIGVVTFIIGLYLSVHLELIFSTGLTSAEYVTAKNLMVLLTINLSFSFPLSTFSLIVSANEKFIILKVIGMLKTLVAPLLTVPLLFMGFKSVAMVLVTILASLFTDICYMVYVLFVLKEKFVFKNFKVAIFKDLFVFTIFIAINMIVDQINWNVDKMLLGRYKGTASVAIYSIGYLLNTYYINFSTAISSVFVPRIHQIVNETQDDLIIQRKRLTELFIKVGRVQFLILGLVGSGLFFWGKDFIVKIWVGREYINSYYVMIILIIPVTVPLIQNLGIEIQRAQNNHKFRSLAYLVMAFVNFFLSIILCQKFGEIGSACGTAFSLVIANGLIMNLYYHKKCNIDIISFWKSIANLGKGFIVPIFVGYLIAKVFTVKSIVSFIIVISLYTVVYIISMWLVGMNEEEKRLILKPLERIWLHGE